MDVSKNASAGMSSVFVWEDAIIDPVSMFSSFPSIKE